MIKRCFQLLLLFLASILLLNSTHALFSYMLLMLIIFSALFLITFVSPEYGTSININVPLSLSRIMMSGLLYGMVLSACTLYCTCLFFVSRATQTRSIRWL